MSNSPSHAGVRSAGFDALRACMTVLVLFHHAAITYGAIGGWYYREVKPEASLPGTLLVLFCTTNQAYFMGLFFLIAGYFTPAAIARKGSWRYLADRGLRLGVPLLFFGGVLGPVTIALAATSRGQPFGVTLVQSWHRHTFENGPLWFAQALLIFAVAAVLYARKPARPGHRDEGLSDASRPWPSNGVLALAALSTGIAALGLRHFWPVGVNVWGLQLGYFGSYVVLFAFGFIAAGPRWLERVPASQARLWKRIALLAFPLLPAAYFIAKAVPFLAGEPLGVIYAFWEPLVAWGVILVLLRRFTMGSRPPGRFQQWLVRRAYAVYIIHPPVLVAIALAWRQVQAPQLVKFALTGSLACIACYLLADLLVRLPGVRRIV
jgi:peptidoglycan/LPS O-acetylase OafA/YrhL